MPKTHLNWSRHKRNWSHCDECELCTNRHKVVLGRGSIPCDVLFIGEAPGASEDTTGKPFKGRAGRLLDALVEAAECDADITPRKFFTNLISCIPLKGGTSKKASEPPVFAIKSCAERLNEAVQITRPRAVVMVGKHSQKWVPKLVDADFEYSCDILHPGSLLRMSKAIRGVSERKLVVTLTDLFEQL